MKTADEINCLKMAVAITEVGWCALLDALKPGVRDRDLVAVANEAMYRAGIEDVWMVIVSSGGPPQTTDKIVRVGDVVTVRLCPLLLHGIQHVLVPERGRRSEAVGEAERQVQQDERPAL